MKVNGDGRPKLLKELWELTDSFLAASAEEENCHPPKMKSSSLISHYLGNFFPPPC